MALPQGGAGITHHRSPALRQGHGATPLRFLRTAAAIVAVMCVAVVAAAGVGAGYCWATGLVDAAMIERIRSAMTDADEDLPEEIEVPEEIAQIAKEEVLQERAMGILDLTARERELNLLKGLLESKAAQVVDAKRELEQAQASFKDKLDAAEAEIVDAAAEQARGILIALPAEDAVQKLMTLQVGEAIRLMKGMPEKTHAKILQEFKTVEQTERSNEIFQAIVRGRPQVDVVQEAAEATR